MDPLSQFDVLVPTFQRLAAAAPVDRLDRPTPCDRWTVRDLFGHLTVGATTFAAVVRGDEPPGDIGPVGDEAVASAATAAVADLDAAFRSSGAMERTIPTPFGEMDGEAFARYIAFDLLMHSWDLARATGQTFTVADEVTAAVDDYARRTIGPGLRGPDTFAPAVDRPAGCDDLEALVAFSGRTP